MIPVTAEFGAAQQADSAMPAYLINLILGDYAASANGGVASSSGDDASGNFPAVGAINSDHTEINIGAPAAADNGLGLASWKSSVAPDGTGNVWLQINFGQARTFTRVKLYNLFSDPLTSYLLQYWNGSAWVNFAGSPDRFTGPGGGSGGVGYGGGGYGGGPYGGANNGGWPGLGYTGGLDGYDFAPITSTMIRLVVYSTKNADPAQVVELEVYRAVDITSRVSKIQGPDRKKDYKLQQPISCQEILTLDNSDQFFSISYTPTAAQVAAGYVNPELQALGLSLEINEGFWTTLGIELIRTFTGSVDSIAPTALTAISELVARDGIKFLINQQDSCRLKTNLDITGCLQYLLNRNGVSNYEMNLATTGIIEPIFFYYEANMLTTVQSLVQAAGDALFFFDEFGNAVLQYYLTATPQQGSYGNATQWGAGTLTNIDNTQSDGSIRREWFLIDNFADGDYTVNPVWTAGVFGVGFVNVTENALVVNASQGGNTAAKTPLAATTGTWRFRIRTLVSSVINSAVWVGFFGNANFAGQANVGPGYAIQQDHLGNLNFVGVDSAGNTTVLAGLGPMSQGVFHEIRVSRNALGVFVVYLDGVLVGTVTDTTFTVAGQFSASAFAFGAPASQIEITDIFYSGAVGDFISTPTNVQAVWISNVIDRGASLSSNGIFNAFASTPPGTNVAYYTAASNDGITFDPFVLATPGAQDPCAVKRYEQVKIVFTSPEDDGLHNANLTTAIVSSITVAWYTGTGQQKWSPSVNFFLNDDNGICDLQEQISDALAGDTSILNDVTVAAAPLVLSGVATDTQWQATAGTISAGVFQPGPPPSYVGQYTAAANAGNVSPTTPLVVAVGTVSFICAIPSGMDISGMAGGSCIAMVLGTAIATAAITFIHPTTPVLTLTVTQAGTITDLRLIGRGYSNFQTPYKSLANDPKSVARNKRRHQDFQNDFIQNGVMTQVIAARIIANQKDPTEYIPRFEIFPPLVNMQPGDRVNVVNTITGISRDYYIVGFSRSITISEKNATAKMSLILLKIPTA